jgi:hypothetical protein
MMIQQNVSQRKSSRPMTSVGGADKNNRYKKKKNSLYSSKKSAVFSSSSPKNVHYFGSSILSVQN